MDRATTPVVAICLLVALTATAATVVAVGAFALEPPDRPARVVLSAEVDAATDRIALTHDGGATVNVTALRVTVAVDGDPLDHQPPVPFFTARGFRAAPTGPFNSGARPTWEAGERSSFRVASTNEPSIEPGSTVRVTVARGDAVLARVRVRAG